MFLNVGISYALREYFYSTNPTSRVGQIIKGAFYKFCNVFVDDIPKYLFTDKIKKLNEFLSDKRAYIIILTLLTILFYFICIFGPYGW